MIEAVVAAIVVVLAAGAVAAPATFLLRRLKTRMIAIGFLAALLVVAGTLIAGIVMFSAHEVIGLAAVAAASAAAAGLIASLVASRMGMRIARFRAAALDLAEGDFSVRIPEDGALELREVAAAFNHMSSSLARLVESRRNLVAWASHDLRAPLASLQAMIEALEDGLAQPDQYLPLMRAQVRVLSSLVDDLFELSRIETGTLALATRDVEVASLVEACVGTLEADAIRRGVRLEVEATPAVARCDPDKVDRILRNLLTNALRHTPHDGAVVVRVAAEEDRVRVAVEDPGEGIPEGASELVFQSFWRADPARDPTSGGAGLGLAIARGLVEAHGGSIWAENLADGGGARFSFIMPAVPRDREVSG